MLNHHPHLLRERCPAFPGIRGDGWKTLCSPSPKGRNYSLPVRPRAQHHFLYDSASPSVSEPETTLTPVGIFSFPIPKSALVQWGDLLLLLRAPWLRATARGEQQLRQYSKGQELQRWAGTWAPCPSGGTVPGGLLLQVLSRTKSLLLALVSVSGGATVVSKYREEGFKFPSLL